MIDTLKLKGLVTLTLRDADTLEIISERTEENLITAYGIQKLMEGGIADDVMAVSVDEFPNIRSLGDWNSPTMNLVQESSIIQGTIHVDGTPSYFERVARFNQPATTKFIKQVMFVANSDWALTKVRLEPPCEQTDSQILDITYRIQYNELTDPNVSGVMPQAMTSRWFAVPATSFLGHTHPDNAFANWHKVPSMQFQRIGYNRDNQISASANATTIANRANERIRRILFDVPMVQADQVGKVFGCVMYGKNESESLNPTSIYSMSHYAPAATDDFVGSPIQPIHNHGVTATAPFLDVNNLATGTGTLSLDGDSWTDPDFPKYVRMDITNTGDVGTARYSYRSRNNVGFSGNGYGSGDAHLGFIHDRQELGGIPSVKDSHGMLRGFDRQQVMYNGKTIITADDTGLTFVDIVSGTYVIFDATTTPALPITNKRKVIVDDSNNVWISDGVAGLFKLVDPLGTPVITHMDNATNGIPVAGETSCRGLGLGAGNTIWAMFDGGLGSTSDGGTTWTLYDSTTPHPFTHIGITDNNWNNVNGICVDKESANQEIGIVYDAGTEQMIWWSTIDVVSPGTVGDDAELLGCSPKGGLWTWGIVSTFGGSNSKVRRIRYGTTESLQFGPNDVGLYNEFGLPMFVADYYGSPHLFSGYTFVLNQGISSGLYNADREFVALMHGFTNYSGSTGRQMTLNLEDSNGVGKGLYLHRTNASENKPQNIRNIAPHGGWDTLNKHYSVYEETVWTKYQWDGAAWVAGYHADAIDTSGNSNDAIRHNFDVENYMFTGRSMVDVEPTFGASTFGSVGTFVFTVKPEPKLANDRTTSSAQEVRATLIEISDGGSNKLKLLWGDDSGNIRIYDNGGNTIVGAKPVDGGTYRIVMAYNATDVKVYLDGTLLATRTLTNTLDFSNVSATLKAHVGARTHAFYNNRYNVGDFYRGYLENVQLWNVEWDQTDVTNDMVDITSVIVSKPGANLISRYELTQSLAGLETKDTHLTDDALFDGITNTFVDGTSSPAFVDGEYYTVGVVDGFLKDNATSITHRSRLYVSADADTAFTTITNATDGSNLVPATTATVTEKPVFYRYTQNQFLTIPGEAVSGSTNGGLGGQTMQSSSGDISIEFAVTISGMIGGVGFSDALASSNNNHQLSFPASSFVRHYIQFNLDGTVDLGFNGSDQSVANTTYVAGDIFKMERVGSSVSFYKVVLGVPQLLFTSGSGSSGDIMVTAWTPTPPGGFYNMTMTYIRPDRMVAFGSDLLSTGLYDPAFIGFDGPVTISANGIPVDVISNSNPLFLMAEPAPGTAYLNYYLGIAKFNAAEIGTAITGSVTLITDLPL